MENDNSLSCTVNIEWKNPQGVVNRKVSHKSASLRLIRNDSREMFIEVSALKAAPIKLNVKGITVHKKFMNEGKSSINFQEVLATMYLSNAPPNQLLTFLRTIFIKMTGQKAQNPTVSLRTQLLSHKPSQFEEISPVTALEVNLAHAKATKSTETTPSPLSKKRKLQEDKSAHVRAPAAKKLYGAASPIPDEVMDVEQKQVLEACLSGRNIFFTGSAGTGKSYLLRKIIGALPPDVTVATASTGVAACHIGGITLHQFAGIGSGNATCERALELASKPSIASNWRRCKHLVIDEISMIDGDFFDKIETIARKIRRNEKPFGGIQLILCGDFFQLPPVAKNKAEVKFCFQAPAWQRCQLVTYELKRVHRQNDPEFVEILNNLRQGHVPGHVVDKLTATARQTIEHNGILATRLCSHTNDANVINESKLKALVGESIVFTAEDSEHSIAAQLDQQTPVPSRLELKIGAQVMLLKNIHIASGLVNGARGVVTEFERGMPVVQFRAKRYTPRLEVWHVKTAGGATVTRKQVPLKLAWAFSIHKSQGLTLDCVEMALGKVFEAGQAYVALSRAQSLETVRILDFKASQVWANQHVVKFYQRMRMQMDVYRPISVKANKENKKKLMGKIKAGAKALMNKPLVVIN